MLETMRDPVRVLVVDAHASDGGLSALLERRPDLVVSASDRDQAAVVGRCQVDAPDVVVIDADVPDVDALDLTRRLRAAVPSLKVVLITARPRPSIVANALTAGACGYAVRSGDEVELASVVRRAAAGELVMPATELPLLLEHLRMVRADGRAAEVGLRRLTARETEILRAMAAGDPTSDIASALEISPLTVQSHMKSILAKLGVHSKIEAVTLAWRHGLSPSITS